MKQLMASCIGLTLACCVALTASAKGLEHAHGKQSDYVGDQRLVSITFRYIGGGESEMQSACKNEQGSHGSVLWGYELVDGATPLPVASAALVNLAGRRTAPVVIDADTALFTVLATDADAAVDGGHKAASGKGTRGKRGKAGAARVLPSSIEVELYTSAAGGARVGVEADQEGTESTSSIAGRVWVHTGCDLPLHVGDRFGFLEVADVQTADGEDGGCANYMNGQRDDTTPICMLLDIDAERGATPPERGTHFSTTAPLAAATTKDPTTSAAPAAGDGGSDDSGIDVSIPGGYDGPLEQPETTLPFASTFMPITTSNEFGTTAYDDMVPNEGPLLIHAQCSITLTQSTTAFPTSIPCGRMAASFGTDAILANVSVGFVGQLCHSQTVTAASGTPTNIYLTVQPVCTPHGGGGDGGDGDGEVNGDVTDSAAAPGGTHTDRVFRVCSWLPNPSDAKCRALPSGGAQCCDSVAEAIAASVEMDQALSCREFSAGDCNTFYGFDGTAAQAFDMSFHGCTGNIPPVPCDDDSRRARTRRSGGGGGTRNNGGAVDANGHVIDSSSSSYWDQQTVTVSKSMATLVGVTGIGLIAVAVGLRLNRMRHKLVGEEQVVVGTGVQDQKDPETSPQAALQQG